MSITKEDKQLGLKIRGSAPNSLIPWNHTPPSMSVPFIDAGMFFSRLCIEKKNSLLETCNKKVSQRRGRNGPKRGFLSQRTMTTVLVVTSLKVEFRMRVETPGTRGLNCRDAMYFRLCAEYIKNLS